MAERDEVPGAFSGPNTGDAGGGKHITLCDGYRR